MFHVSSMWAMLVLAFMIPRPAAGDALVQTQTDTIWLPPDTVWIAQDTVWSLPDTVWIPSDTVYIQPPPDTVYSPPVVMPPDTVWMQLPPDTVVTDPVDPPVEPPEPGVLFDSDWRYDLGMGQAAVSDGGRWYTNVNDALDLTVIPADELFVAGFLNCLDVPMGVYEAGHQFEGVAYKNAPLSWTIDPPLTAGSDLYIRFYFRNDLADELYDPSHTYGGNHPNELEHGPQNPNIGFKWDDAPDGTFMPVLMTERVVGTTNFESTTRLQKFTEYRWEIHVHILTETSYTLESRVYDAAGNLVLDDADFGLRGQTLWAYADGWRVWKMGNNGPSWRFMNNMGENVTAWRFGGVCVRNDDWCGPYSDGG